MDHSVVGSRVCLCGAGMRPPSPSQHHPPVSARPPNYEEPHVKHSASPQSTLLQQNVQNKLRQLEQLQYNLTKQVCCMAVVGVGDSSLQADKQSKSIGLIQGSAATGRCFTFIWWTEELLQWFVHDDSTIYLSYYY